MRILHYFLGLNRAGGVCRYVSDLIQCQIKNQHEIFVISPEASLLPQKEVKIVYAKKVNGFSLYKLIGGCIVPLSEGIKDPKMIFGKKMEKTSHSICSFCDDIHPDIVHIHTWMGFPFELLFEFKKRNCKIIYTVHDYFGLCPRVNFINNEHELCLSPDNVRCTICNSNAPSEFFLRLQNYPILIRLKKYLRAFAYCILKWRRTLNVNTQRDMQVKDYSCLFSYYKSLFLSCNQIHFNSFITQSVFKKFIPELKGKVIPITHGHIQDHRKYRKNLNQSFIQIGFIGSNNPHKGLPLLLETLSKMQDENVINWKLDVWGTPQNQNNMLSPLVSYHGFFSVNDMEKVFHSMDVLIVPSVCFETFGFIVAEALSFGVPVLCSDTVGAQCLVSPDMVYHEKDGLHQSLIQILQNPGILEEERRKICSSATKILMMDEHAKAMEEFYLE